MSKVLIKHCHMHAGLDLIGSKTNVSHHQGEIEATALGARVISKKTGRIVLIPWANIKGCELFSETELEKIEQAKKSREKPKLNSMPTGVTRQ